MNPEYFSAYAPFGVMVPKRWLFALGGRPVIYQPDDEYDVLPDSVKWRHVRYDPDAQPPVDFTWEREWRIRAAELAIDPATAAIVVAEKGWAERLVDEHAIAQQYDVLQYSLILEHDVAALLATEPFQWRIVTLK
jgi:hypothetical protein